MPSVATLTSNGGSTATSFVTASISPSNDRVILVSIHAYISTGSVQPATPAVTGNGITYDLVHSRTVDTSGVDRANLFVFRGRSSTAGAITISFGAVTMTRCSWIVEETDTDVDLSGLNGAGAIVQTVSAISGSGALNLSVNYAPGITTDNAGYSVWGHQVQEGKTPRASWTELADVTAVTLSCIESQMISGTDSAASASWVTGSRAGGIALEIKKLPPFIWWDQYALQGGTTALTMIPPAGTAAGDLEIIWVLDKNSSVDPTDPSGGAAGTWNRIDSAEVGTGADGVGTGKIRITAWYRILATASTNTAITITGANRSIGGGMVYKLTAGGTWAVPTASFGSDVDDTSTTFLATMAADLAAEVDEYLLSIGAYTAITSLGGRALTAPGVSSSRFDNVNSVGGSTGNHIFTWTDQRVVVAGTQSGASSTGSTSGVGTTGGAMQIKIGLPAGTEFALGLAAEANTALALTSTKAPAVGLAVEVDQALTPNMSKNATLLLPTEADTALAIATTKAFILGLATERDQSLALEPSKLPALGLAVEIDLGLSPAVSKTSALGLPTERDTASSLTFSKSSVLGLALSAELALVLSGSKSAGFGLAAERDQVLALAAEKIYGLGLATEADIALALDIAGQVAFALGLAESRELALSLVITKSVQTGLPIEVDAALAVAVDKSLTLGLSTESDIALPVIFASLAEFGLVIERNVALTLVLPGGGGEDNVIVYRNGVPIAGRMGGVVRDGLLIPVVEFEVT